MRFPRHVSQNMTVLTLFGTVLTLFGPPYQANSFMEIGQNSAKYRPALRYTGRPFHRADELHQKDLRINLIFLQILGLRTEGILRADTFLALSLIVENTVPRPS